MGRPDNQNRAAPVLVFHPIHIYLNTEKLERYERSKSCLQDVPALDELRNKGPKLGVRDIFRNFLAQSCEQGRTPCSIVSMLEGLDIFDVKQEGWMQ
jgi:hypothetical protein